MSTRQIINVDVVTNASAVGCWVVRPKNIDRLALAECDLKDKRNEMGFGIVVFADRAIGCGAGRVEVTKCRVTKPVGVRIVGQRVLNYKFCVAVRADWMLWVI